MTISELKEYADRFGYDIVPKERYVFCVPCVCGSRQRTMHVIYDTVEGCWAYRLECNKCGTYVIGKTASDARSRWNKHIWGMNGA